MFPFAVAFVALSMLVGWLMCREWRRLRARRHAEAMALAATRLAAMGLDLVWWEGMPPGVAYLVDPRALRIEPDTVTGSVFEIDAGRFEADVAAMRLIARYDLQVARPASSVWKMDLGDTA